MERLSKEEKAEALTTMVKSRGWQMVLMPALQAVISTTTECWMENKRIKGEEQLTDGELKARANALRWVLGWEKRAADIVNELEQLEAIRAQTEPAEAGGSPY